MKMALFNLSKGKKNSSISTDEVEAYRENPYINAKNEWQERFGSYIVRARNWQIMALILAVIAGISIYGNIYQASKSEVVPYIVEVDELGRISVVGEVDKMIIPPERVIQATLIQVIHDWRSVTVDIQVQRNMMKRLSFFFSGSARGVIKEWYEEEGNNPYAIAESGKLVSVEIKSLPLNIEDNAYRIEWTETTRSHTGIKQEVVNYQANVTIALQPPLNEQVLMYNPAGIYITSLNTSKVFESNEKE